MKKYAIIVAGGSGARMGGGTPKQFRDLCGHPVLWWSLNAFHKEDPATKIILVLPADYIDYWKHLSSSMKEEERIPHTITTGGCTRTESVKNGLKLITVSDSFVAVHDGARPLLKPENIRKGWQAAVFSGAAIPVVPVTDSLRRIQGNKTSAVDRNSYVAVQTPQVFKTSILNKCYEIAGDKVFTDDASVVESARYEINLFEGSHDNIKITNPNDIEIASVIMKKNG